jgi:hypothetical protein
MLISSRLAAALAVAALCVACDKPAEQAPAAPPAQAPATTAAVPAATAPAATVATADEVGVPECDSFLKKYYACLDTKVPAEAKPMLKSSVDQMRASWKQAAASSPQAKSALATGCAQSETQAKASMAAYNCTW